MVLVAIWRSAFQELVEGLVSLVGLVVLENVSELCEEEFSWGWSLLRGFSG